MNATDFHIPAPRAHPSLSTHQIIDKYFDLTAGEERVSFLRGNGLSDEEIERFWLCPTFSDKDDFLKRLYKPKLPTAIVEVSTTPVPPRAQSLSSDPEYIAVPFELPAANLPSQSRPEPHVATPKVPDGFVAVANAHPDHDRAGTLYQSQLVEWVPNIQSLPHYTAFDLFGELNGELVDLVFFVNRKGSTCYVGNVHEPRGTACSVKWDKAVLGPLPTKGEKFLVKVISINPRTASNGAANTDELFDDVHVKVALTDGTTTKIALVEELFDDATGDLLMYRIRPCGSVCRGRYDDKKDVVKAVLQDGKPVLLMVEEPTCGALIAALVKDQDKIDELRRASRA